MGKAKEFRDMSVEELQALYQDSCHSLYHLINELKKTKKIEKPHLIKEKKKDIARLLTIITEKQSEAQHRTA
jgi:large subunit ribosomal protein L29